MGIDQQRLMAEIHAEVRDRRASGELPDGLEAELDAMFERYAPPSVSNDFDAVLERAEVETHIDYSIPLASKHPALVLFKKVLGRFMAWYVRSVAIQVSEFAATITRSVRLLGDRITRLERSVPGADAAVARERMRAVAPPTDHAWDDALVRFLQPAPGRVLVADAGRGVPVATLVAGGVDAYGVEPQRALADEAAGAGLEVRSDDVFTHLGAVPAGSLGGVLLTGVVDRLAIGEVLALADAVSTALAPEGRLAIVTTAPGHWARSRPPVEVDLAPGRPLHPETWAHILRARRMSELVITERESSFAFESSAEDSPIARDVHRLAGELLGPESYLVFGVRER